jgi:LTXXQ motif family protein
LNFRQKMIEDQLETVKAINPKLIAFYNSLNPEQKNKFDQMREHLASQRKR